MSKIAVIVGIIALLILSVAVLWKANQTRNRQENVSITPNQNVSSPSGESSTLSVVTFTNGGFSPSSLTVKQGTAVTFKNSSSNPFRPASDPHPIHTAYREFDARQSIAAGQSYTFTFGKVGSWGYHDHLNPTRVGTMVVE